MAKYKNKTMQHMYDTMLQLAAIPDSELYWKGEQRKGAGHRCAFWDGFNGVEKSPHVIPGSMSVACYQAGREWKRQTEKQAKAMATTDKPHTIADLIKILQEKDPSQEVEYLVVATNEQLVTANLTSQKMLGFFDFELRKRRR